MTLNELAKKFAEHKAEKDRLAELDKANNEAWAKIEAEMLEMMANEGTSQIRIENVGLFSLATKNYMSVSAANKAQFFDYLQESGNGGLLKLDVHPATLQSFLKSHLEELVQTSVTNGKDEFEAREEALTFLKDKGAALFSDKKIQMRKA